jgi:hypothetical protein
MLRPDCFGISALVTPGLRPCSDCGARDACRSEALASLPDVPEAELVRARLIVGAGAPLLSPSGAPMRPLSDDEKVRLKTLSKRAQPLARTLAEGCFFEQVAQSHFPQTPKAPLNLALQLLAGGPVKRADLVRAFVERLDLSAGAAQVEASTVIAALEFGRVARLDAGLLVLTPNRH